MNGVFCPLYNITRFRINNTQSTHVIEPSFADNLTINGVLVEDFNILSDGTVVLTLSDFLFDHRHVVDEILHALPRTNEGLFAQKHGKLKEFIYLYIYSFF